VLQPGELFDGKFRIEHVLGQGGMGVVAVATHVVLDQKVAIKVLHEGIASDPSIAERLVREARAAARLRSEHVCRVSDVGVAHGTPYIVMELLEGTDLATLIDRRPLPIATAVDYVLQACIAIAEAHALGIVHRDLKPANLFVTRRLDGSPLIKVLDFGIAKAPSTTSVALTQTETMMGTPGYMSPEQLRSARSVDHRTDLWALGVILYQAVSGRLPFPANSITEAAVKISVDPPDPIDIEPSFRAVILRCLEKEPAKRHRDIAALARDLVRFGGPTAASSAALIDHLSSNAAIASTILAAPSPKSTTTLEAAAGEPRALRTRGGRTALVIGAALAVCGIAVAVWSMSRTPQQATSPPVVAAQSTHDAAIAPDTSIAITPIEPAPVEREVPEPAPASPPSKPTPKPRAKPVPSVDAGVKPDAPPQAAKADVTPAKGEADLDRALKRHRCVEAGRIASEISHRPDTSKDAAARVEARAQECIDQRTIVMRKPNEPAAEPWLLATVDELRELGHADDARTLYSNFYYGRTIDACMKGDAKAAKAAATKVSPGDMKNMAINVCNSKQIDISK